MLHDIEQPIVSAKENDFVLVMVETPEATLPENIGVTLGTSAATLWTEETSRLPLMNRCQMLAHQRCWHSLQRQT